MARRPELEVQLRYACADLESRLRSGADCRADDYFSRYPELADEPELALDLLYTEYLVRSELTEVLVAEDMLERYPRWQSALEEQFRMHRWFRPGGSSKSFPGVKPPKDTPEFQILEELGRGGMGVVYKAVWVSTGEVVALKLVLSGVHAGPEERERFRREGAAVARLDHPNVVKVLWIGEHNKVPSLALEYLEGGTLAEKLAGHPVPPRAAAELVEPLARAVHHIHQRGILHRDVSPRNVLLTRDGVPKLTDFGLVKFVESRAETASGLSKTASVLGTPQYAAPEQLRSGTASVGPGTDVYGLGAILYEALVGRPPFRADTILATIDEVARLYPTPPRRLRPDVPRDLETICLTCLEKDPRKRYLTAEALEEDLQRFLAGESILARPPSAWEYAVRWARRHPGTARLIVALVAMAVLSFGLVTWQWWRADAARKVAVGLAASEAEARREAADAAYVTDVALAEREWSAGNVGRYEELLAGCHPDRRGWEWHYLRRLVHGPLPPLDAHGVAATAVAVSPDGRLVASAGVSPDGGEVKLWDPATGREVRPIRCHPEPVRGVAFRPDGKVVATAGQDGSVRLWEVATGRLLHTLTDHVGPVWGVAFSPDGKLVASAGQDKMVRLWNPSASGKARVLAGHTARVVAVAFAPDGKTLASAAQDHTARLWDPATGRELRVLRGHEDRVTAVAFSPDGKVVATAGHDQTARLWEAATGTPTHVLRGHVGSLWAVAFSPDGTRLATGGWDKTVKLWDPAAGRKMLTLRGHRDNIWGVAFAPHGRRLVSAGNDGTVRVWDAGDPPPPSGRQTVIPATGRGWRTSAAFSPDGRRITAGHKDGSVEILDVQTRQRVFRLTGHTDAVLAVAYSPDGLWVASAGEDGPLRVWDAAAGREHAVLRHHADRVRGLAFSPDGKLLASAGQDRTVGIWNPETGQLLRALTGHGLAVTAVAFGPDNRTVASGSLDRTIRLWDAQAGTDQKTLRGNTLSVTAVAFNRDGSRIASAGADGVVRVWDPATGQEVRAMSGHTDRVLGVAFSPDGRLVASAGEDWTVRVWDAASGREVECLRGHTDVVWSAAFSPDGTRVVSASKDRTIRLWDVDRARP